LGFHARTWAAGDLSPFLGIRTADNDSCPVCRESVYRGVPQDHPLATTCFAGKEPYLIDVERQRISLRGPVASRAAGAVAFAAREDRGIASMSCRGTRTLVALTLP
jgi:hypothetical protein